MLQQKDEVQKAEFFKGLPALLPEFPRRLLHTKVLTHLLEELANPLQVHVHARSCCTTIAISKQETVA